VGDFLFFCASPMGFFCCLLFIFFFFWFFLVFFFFLFFFFCFFFTSKRRRELGVLFFISPTDHRRRVVVLRFSFALPLPSALFTTAARDLGPLFFLPFPSRTRCESNRTHCPFPFFPPLHTRRKKVELWSSLPPLFLFLIGCSGTTSSPFFFSPFPLYLLFFSVGGVREITEEKQLASGGLVFFFFLSRSQQMRKEKPRRQGDSPKSCS